MNTGFYGVEVAVKVLYRISSNGATRVVYIPLPETRWGKEVRALDSIASITRSATTTETGEPVGRGSYGSYGRRKKWHSGKIRARW